MTEKRKVNVSDPARTYCILHNCPDFTVASSMRTIIILMWLPAAAKEEREGFMQQKLEYNDCC